MQVEHCIVVLFILGSNNTYNTLNTQIIETEAAVLPPGLGLSGQAKKDLKNIEGLFL
jgi:hypothetical protein